LAAKKASHSAATEARRLVAREASYLTAIETSHSAAIKASHLAATKACHSAAIEASYSAATYACRLDHKGLVQDKGSDVLPYLQKISKPKKTSVPSLTKQPLFILTLKEAHVSGNDARRRYQNSKIKGVE